MSLRSWRYLVWADVMSGVSEKTQWSVSANRLLRSVRSSLSLDAVLSSASFVATAEASQDTIFPSLSLATALSPSPLIETAFA